MRKIRLKEILNNFSKFVSANTADLADKPAHKISVSKQQMDDAKFMMKYLDTTDNKSYQQYFCNYNEKMFA